MYSYLYKKTSIFFLHCPNSFLPLQHKNITPFQINDEKNTIVGHSCNDDYRVCSA